MIDEKIDKIVELDIDDEELTDDVFDGTGVEIVSIVDRPAIQADFLYFNDEEFITPNPCQTGYEAIGTKIKNGREVPNCVPIENIEQFVEPTSGESEDDFIGRCMGKLEGEFPDRDQRLAVCYSYWRGQEELASIIIDGRTAYDTVEEAEEKAAEFGCVGYHTHEVEGQTWYMPCETHDEGFETYNDYPEGARSNACRAIEWAEENGWGSCGTNVGKQRAHQLCKGENISRDTIARMAAFERHRRNSDTPYSEGCGKLMWDAWGGDSGIRWAQNKLEELELDGHSCKYGKKADGTCKKKPSGYDYTAILEYAESDDNGYYIGNEDLYIDMTVNKFAGIGDVVTAIRSLDILKRLSIKKEDAPETYWRYSGPPAQRDFCRAMLRLADRGKIFTTEEVNKMTTLNRDFGPRGNSSYSKLEWKGGPNCTHFWTKLEVFKGDTGNKVIIASNRADNEKERKAMKSNNQRQPSPQGSTPNNAYLKKRNFSLSIDEDKRMVVGPLMIPNKMILRRDEEGNPFYIYFSKKTIRKMAEKFFRNNKHNNTDVNHDENITQDNTLIESWISESIKHDKSYKYGFALPEGTWYVSYKINDDETWNRIKSGELKGFSLAGGFIQRMKPVDPESTLNDIKDILKKVKE